MRPMVRGGDRSRTVRGGGLQDAGREDEGGTGIDGHRDPQCFGDLFAGSTVPYRGIRVYGDAAVTANRHGNGKRDQLPNLRAQQVVLLPSAAHSAVASHRVRSKPTDLADSVDHLLTVLIPIEHHGTTLGASCRAWHDRALTEPPQPAPVARDDAALP